VSLLVSDTVALLAAAVAEFAALVADVFTPASEEEAADALAAASAAFVVAIIDCSVTAFKYES
tara:strand:- start:3603 stop:3791 length:189 start_codon:yes stop_codon:yes gene_type:complete